MNSSPFRLVRGLLLVGGLAIGVSCNGPQAALPPVSEAGKAESERPGQGLSTVQTNGVSTPTNSTPAALAAARALVEPKNMSPGLQDVVKLARGGVNDDVMKAFVQQSTNTFTLGPEELLFLSDLGVAPEVITAMQRKGSGNSSNAPSPAGMSVAAPSPTVPPTPAPVAVAPPDPSATQVVTPNYVQPGPIPGVLQPGVQPPPGTVTVAVPVPEPGAPVVFQEALSPYGVWVEVPGYGRCWQPNYATLTPGWRPYQHGGRWVWSDYGWYWVSDYPWGWATFHYGRWFSSPAHGWVWAPDSVWGPSWVCWRRTSSHCGWAPLPPGAYFSGGSWFHHGLHVDFEFGFGLGFADFAFLPWGRFCDPRPHHFYASASHTPALYHQSVVANSVVVNNNTTVFQGAGRSTVALASRMPIPQASLRETAYAASKSSAEQLVPDKNGFTIVSPRVPTGGPVMPSSTPGTGRRPITGSVPLSNPQPGATPTLAQNPAIAAGAGAALGFAAGRAAFNPTVGQASVAIPSTRSNPTATAASVPVAPRAVPVTTPPTATIPTRPSSPSVVSTPPAPSALPALLPSSVSVRQAGVALPAASPAPAWVPASPTPLVSVPTPVAPRPTVVAGGSAPFAPVPARTYTPPVSHPSIPAAGPSAVNGAVGPVSAPFIPGPPPAPTYHPAPPAFSGGNSGIFRGGSATPPQYSAPSRQSFSPGPAVSQPSQPPPAASVHSAPPSRSAPVSAPSGSGRNTGRSGGH